MSINIDYEKAIAIGEDSLDWKSEKIQKYQKKYFQQKIIKKLHLLK